MSREPQPHDHPAVDWFRVLDIAVWAAVVVVAVIGLEWLAGYVVRERLAAGARKHLANVTAGGDQDQA